MKKVGFSWLKGVADIQYNTPDVSDKVVNEIKSPSDNILDQIFGLDEHGWPNNTLQLYLSEKTADDVRRFIEQNILVNSGQQNFVQDEKIVAEYKNLTNDFIAQCSRNRFESIEQYEERLQKLVMQDEENELYQRAKSWRDSFFKKVSLKND
jgi:hypothetical protein